MKILIFLAVLMTIVGMLLGDVVLGIFGVVSLACAGADVLNHCYDKPAAVVSL